MSAVISECGRYRYSLERKFLPAAGDKTVMFIGVNPSTADATVDDQTVRKWCGFAARWGFGRVLVGNLFAWRSTDVDALASAPDPVGPLNAAHLTGMFQQADIVVPCWGSRNKMPRSLHGRIDEMRTLLRCLNRPIHVLGLTGSGDPKHPLMLGYDTPRVEWTP